MEIIIEDHSGEYHTTEALEARDETIRQFMKYIDELNTYAKPTLESISKFERWIKNHLRFELDSDTEDILMRRMISDYPWAAQILGIHGDRSEAAKEVFENDYRPGPITAISTVK